MTSSLSSSAVLMGRTTGKKNNAIVIILPILATLSILIFSFRVSNNQLWKHYYTGVNNSNNNEVSSSRDNSDEQQHCESILDKFDKTFNDRRTARQRRVILLNNPDNNQNQKEVISITEKEALVIEKEFWDLYEPEAICFTEERVGKTSKHLSQQQQHNTINNNGTNTDNEDSFERYDSFGDGPKFICGIDTIAASANTNAANASSSASSSSSSSLTTVASSSTSSNNENNNNNCLVYSIGSSNNIDFEMAVSKFTKSNSNGNNGCEIHTFDPTIEYQNFIGHDYATFHQWGLGNDNSRMNRGKYNWISKSFNTIINELNHTGRTIDILKIDCELCEWFTMPQLFQDITNSGLIVNQIQIEMHRSKRKVVTQNITSFFEFADNAKMRIFHKERNGWGCDGYRCIEYAFISEDFLRKVNKEAIC